jgi:transcriptional regulator with XRE-family HTH domain
MDESTAVRLGARIALLREQKGMSLGDLAGATSLAKSYLSKMEKGEALNPGLATLATIADSLGVTVHELLPRRQVADVGPHQTSASGQERVVFETVSEYMPDALRDFIADQERRQDAVPPDAIRALAVLKLRGKRPETVEDYRLLYSMLSRLVE